MNEQNVNTQSQGEVEIDLVELFGVLMHHALMLILAALILGAAAYCYSRFLLPEEFQSSTTIYMLDRANPDSGATTNSDLQASAQLTKDYSQLITSRHVLEKVIENLGLPYGYSVLKGSVSVSTPNDGRIVTITVTDNNPRMAQKIADEIRIVGSEHIINVMEIDAVNVIDEANLPTYKSAPSNGRWAMIGALLGFVAVAAVVILRYILDDTIKTQDDVDRYLGISTLALIPLDENIGENQKGLKTRKKSRKSREEDDFSEVSTSDSYIHSDEIASQRKKASAPQRAAAQEEEQAEQQSVTEDEFSGEAVEEPVAEPETRTAPQRPAQNPEAGAAPDRRAADPRRTSGSRRPDAPDSRQNDPRRSGNPNRRAADPRSGARRPAAAAASTNRPAGRPAPASSADAGTAAQQPQIRSSKVPMNTEELVRDAVEATGHSLASEIAGMMEEDRHERNARPAVMKSEASSEGVNGDTDVDLDIIDLD